MSQTFSSVTEYPADAVCPDLPVTGLDIKVYNNVATVIHVATTDVGTTNDVTVKTYYVFPDGTEVEYDSDTWNASTGDQLRVFDYAYKVDRLRVKITQTGTGGGIIRMTANVSQGK